MSCDGPSSAQAQQSAKVAGRWAFIVGPSGAGKDTLINLSRQKLSSKPEFRFARRVVTRPPNAFEDHDTALPDEFAAMKATNEFVLDWTAHGLAYGIHRDWHREVEAGAIVICNVSRTIIEAARARFANVSVILITAPGDVLAARIAARGRDAAAGSRTNRRLDGGTAFEPDLTINNTGTAQDGARQLTDFLVRLAQDTQRPLPSA